MCEYSVGSYNNRGRYVGGPRKGEDIEWNNERIKGASEQTEELIQQIIELSYECVVCVFLFVYSRSNVNYPSLEALRNV